FGRHGGEQGVLHPGLEAVHPRELQQRVRRGHRRTLGRPAPVPETVTPAAAARGPGARPDQGDDRSVTNLLRRMASPGWWVHSAHGSPEQGGRLTLFERFTDRARRVVVLAQEEARLLNHNYIGTEHILLGLIHE